MQKLTHFLDSGYPLYVIYLDFEKAFDKVPYKLMKLQAHGIDRELLRWIKGWLSERKQRVVINGQYSSVGFHRISLGTTVVCHYIINDIDKSIGCNILKFADDTKIFGRSNHPQLTPQ